MRVNLLGKQYQVGEETLTGIWSLPPADPRPGWLTERELSELVWRQREVRKAQDALTIALAAEEDYKQYLHCLAVRYSKTVI